MEHTCPNCNAPTHGNFCANCGQKTDTHRITIKHFLFHDLLHGMWHLDRGILFTVKETLVRPGRAALDYISGKRIRYYNIFYLCLLVIGLHIVLVHLYDYIHPERLSYNENNVEVTDFFTRYMKVLLLGIVPIIAIDARLMFPKMKLNLAEHFILSGINLLGMLLVGLFFVFFNFLNELGSKVSLFIGWMEVLSFFALFIYPAWTYGNAAIKYHTFLGTMWRLAVFLLLIFVEMMVLLMGIFYLVTQDTAVTISM